jgi:hypothetical protein
MEEYLQLFLKSVQSNRAANRKCVVIAFTASGPGEGVSYVVESFALEMARRTKNRVLIAQTKDLKAADIHHQNLVENYCEDTIFPNLSILTAKPLRESNVLNEKLQVISSDSVYECGSNNLQTLRYSFDFILLDCSSLSASADAVMLASSVDGVVVVVEADRTRKDKVRKSISTIQNAEGNFLGCVLNKRKYTVPNWIYKRL